MKMLIQYDYTVAWYHHCQIECILTQPWFSPRLFSGCFPVRPPTPTLTVLPDDATIETGTSVTLTCASEYGNHGTGISYCFYNNETLLMCHHHRFPWVIFPPCVITTDFHQFLVSFLRFVYSCVSFFYWLAVLVRYCYSYAIHRMFSRLFPIPVQASRRSWQAGHIQGITQWELLLYHSRPWGGLSAE